MTDVSPTSPAGMPPMVDAGLPEIDDCWTRIGVHGDGSCPELKAVTHCHNCQVFIRASRSLFDRPLPDGYLDEWGTILARPKELREASVESVVVFRLAGEWLAISTRHFRDVCSRLAIHRLPHRHGLLMGLVNVQGEVQPYFSLADLLGIAMADARPKTMIVLEHDEQLWVFPVDEVAVVYRAPSVSIDGAPATVGERSEHGFTRGIIPWEGKRVAWLDLPRLVAELVERAL